MKKIHNIKHIPVLLDCVVNTFDMLINPLNVNFIKSDITHDVNINIIDCTLGFGGMSKALLEKYDNINVIGIDRDIDAIKYNKDLETRFRNRIKIIHGSFGDVLPNIISDKKYHIHAILADIGVSSYQLDTIERGFSFNSKELDMRMDISQHLDANIILNSYSKYELERIFREYGEIREYKKLANLIITQRAKGNITSEVLQDIALKVHSKRGLHPATLIYQALRIEVNDELGQLYKLLNACKNLNNVLICIISFHSLEDRIIKDTFKQWTKNCICEDNVLKCECGNNNAKGFNLYKKPLVASQQELQNNKRARSAKLRAFYLFDKSEK